MARSDCREQYTAPELPRQINALGGGKQPKSLGLLSRPASPINPGATTVLEKAFNAVAEPLRAAGNWLHVRHEAARKLAAAIIGQIGEAVAAKSAFLLRIVSEFLKATAPAIAGLLIHDPLGLLGFVLGIIALAVFMERKIVRDPVKSGWVEKAE